MATAACHGASTPSPVTDTITPAGGTVAISDGTSVSVPAGAVAANTAITVGPESDSVSINGVVLVGDTYRFGPEGTQFTVPVTVTLAYDPSKLTSGTTASDVTIMTAPVGSSDFTPLATTSVDATHVSATTTHFSDFVAVVRKNADVDLSVSMSVVDLAMPTIDLAGGVDLAMNPDMSDPCAPFMLTVNGCVLTGTGSLCMYRSLNCAQATCYCQNANMGGSVVEKPAPYTGQIGCPPQAVMEQIWTTAAPSGCGFP
jgi:hypothetical protein